MSSQLMYETGRAMARVREFAFPSAAPPKSTAQARASIPIRAVGDGGREIATSAMAEHCGGTMLAFRKFRQQPGPTRDLVATAAKNWCLRCRSAVI